jgi:predicted short-subunit dehydrogenase-like oxidoreductase (DUF2520 family)
MAKRLTPSVGIIGPGRAGLGLALALRRAGIRVLGVHGRRRKPVPRGIALSTGDAPPWLGAADVILLAVRDDALPEAVRQLRRRVRPGQIVLHLSGALTSRVLRPLAAAGARTGSIHPLMTVSAEPARAARSFAGATFAVAGDAAALKAARRLVGALGGAAVRVPDAARTYYHAGAVFASNYLVAMLGAAEALLMAAGFSERAARTALAPLARASLANVTASGPARALTGPVARGDAETVKRHLRALPRPLKGVYGAAGGVALRLAELAGLDAGRARAVRRALGGRGA